MTEPLAPTDAAKTNSIITIKTDSTDRYRIDTVTQICWLVARGGRVKSPEPAVRGISVVDCCDVRKRAAAREHIDWESDASCSDLPDEGRIPQPTAPAAPDAANLAPAS